MEVLATAKYVRIAPQRARLVARSIKGLTAEEAMAALAFLRNRAASAIAKVVKSAASNAENNYGLDREELTVRDVRIDQGPSLRRSRAKARGRIGLYRKRSSHITVVVDDGS